MMMMKRLYTLFMNLRSGRTLDYEDMPVGEMEKFSLPERKQVLLDTRLRGKRIIGLRTYYKELEKERRGTLISLFKTGNVEAVDQIVNILLELTLTTEAQKPPKLFDLDQYMIVYKKTYETWVFELLSLMNTCDNCGKPTWDLVGNIIASLPLDRIYGQTICLCVDNLLEYCSYDDTHYCIYFARIDPKVNPVDERPFISD